MRITPPAITAPAAADPAAEDLAERGALAAEAVAAGQRASAAGDSATALRWLDRAHRLAPHDPLALLALAAARLGSNPAGAARLLAGLPAPRRTGEAWLLLAAARRALGDAAGAARALAAALQRAALPEAFIPLADAIARDATAPGWCGLGPDSRLRLRPVAPGASPLLRLDGRAVPAGPPLPTAGRRLSARIGGRPLLGSPLRLDLLRRAEPGDGAPAKAGGRDQPGGRDPLPPATRPPAAPSPRPAVLPVVLIITHADGGGVERMVAASCRAHRRAGRRPLLLRPAAGEGRGRAVVLSAAEPGPDGAGAEATFALPADLPALRRALAAEGVAASGPAAIELHHLLGHPPAVAGLLLSLGLPLTLHVHDYAWVCPRVQLVGPGGVYCGEPDLSGCRACVTAAGSLLDEAIDVAALRARSAALLAAARRVVVPSADAAARLARQFPAVRAEIVAPGRDAALPAPPPLRPRSGRARIAVIGAIGAAKGYDVLAACARDAAARDLPLEFVVIGATIGDRALLATGRVFVTGPFRAREATALIRAQGADLALLPSVWPETWCFALTDAWRAGLRVAAFDLGAPAERIRRTGWGLLLPLPPPLPWPADAAPARRINETLLAAISLPVHEDASEAVAAEAGTAASSARGTGFRPAGARTASIRPIRLPARPRHPRPPRPAS